MAIAEELKLVVKAQVDEAIAKMNKFNMTTQKSKMGIQGLMSKIGQWALGMATVTAGVMALRKAMRLAFDSVQYAAQVTQIEKAFGNIAKSAGYVSSTVLNEIRKMSLGTISDLKLMKSASRAALFDIPLDKLDELMNIAMASATATGESVEYMFESIVTGIGRASPLILDNLGLAIRTGEAYKAMADELGKTSEELTIAERKQALMNEVLRSGSEVMEKVGDAALLMTDAQRWEKFQATISNVQGEIGRTLLPVFRELALQANNIMSDFEEMLRMRNIAMGLTPSAAEEQIAAKRKEIERLKRAMRDPLVMAVMGIATPAILLRIRQHEREIALLEQEIGLQGEVGERLRGQEETQRRQQEIEEAKVQALKEAEEVLDAHKKLMEEIASQRLESDLGLAGLEGRLHDTTVAMNELLIASGTFGTIVGNFVPTETEEAEEAVESLTDSLNRLRHAEEYVGQKFIETNSTLQTTADLLKELQEDAKETAREMANAMAPFTDAIGQMFVDTAKGWEMFKDAAKNAIASMLEALAQQAFAQAAYYLGLSLIPGMQANIPGAIALGAAGTGLMVASGIVKALKEGGIVTQPTPALIGEAGPEAVIPLDKMGRLGNITIVQNIRGSVLSEREVQSIAVSGVMRAGRGY